jgi:hypothetical protein
MLSLDYREIEPPIERPTRYQLLEFFNGYCFFAHVISPGDCDMSPPFATHSRKRSLSILLVPASGNC